MSEDERRQPSIEEMEAAVRRFKEEDNRYLAMLGFDWRASPQRHHAGLRGHPLEAPATLEVTLRNGRLMALRDLHQYFVYAGALSGMPPSPESEFIGAIKTAQRVFSVVGQRPIVLEPVLNTAPTPTGRDGKPFPYPYIWLPKVCTIAQFESDSPARDQSELYSTLVIIWFQETYGLPDDARTLEQLRNVDWIAHAVDWTP